MPYKFETTHKKLPKELDRRLKLTDKQRLEIINLYNTTWISQRALSRMFNVDRGTIRNILFPTKYQVQLKKYKELKWSKKYYNKDKNTIAMRETRKHKQKNKNLLID